MKHKIYKVEISEDYLSISRKLADNCEYRITYGIDIIEKPMEDIIKDFEVTIARVDGISVKV